ncbi:MAG: glycosyltransferase family 9 protein [Ignavibacteriales bacterium]|nr:glycosyltransferase family 9 protein [Ignavibacteriales bacterium]
MINKESIKKILIIKLRGIGDVVLSTIVLDNLRSDFPDAEIDYLTEAPSKPGLEGLPQINNVILLPKDFFQRVKLIREIRRNCYDLVIDFYSNPATAQITFLSGAKYRAGFPYRGRKYAYNFFGPDKRNKVHSALLHLQMLDAIGVSSTAYDLYYYVNEDDKSFVNYWLENNSPKNHSLFGLSPSGGWNSKKCDPEKFAEIGLSISEKYNIKGLIVWGKSDYDDALKIKELMGGKVFIAPATTIRQMAAFISECKFLIANDSGPMHISTAIGTPVLSLHGPTDPRLQGPFGAKHEWVNLDELDCIMCNLLECPINHECFKDLPVKRVLDKVELLIKKNNISI